jgi:hypothetical protein
MSHREQMLAPDSGTISKLKASHTQVRMKNQPYFGMFQFHTQLLFQEQAANKAIHIQTSKI